MANKYFKNDDIKINHIYEDSKGFLLIYIGKATQDDGCWNYPLSHIYIKKEAFDKYPISMSLEEILNDLQEKGVRHYCFSEKHRKLIKDVGKISKSEIHGKCGIFDFE